MTTSPPDDPHLRQAAALFYGDFADRVFADVCRSLGVSPNDCVGSPLQWIALLRAVLPHQTRN